MSTTHMRLMSTSLVVLCFLKPVWGDEKPALSLLPDIATVKTEIQQAEDLAAQYTDGTMLALIQQRIETLRLTKALLEQRAIAEASNTEVDFKLPAVEPDLKKADELLQDIVSAEAERTRLQAEADKYSGGLVRSMALVALATHEQTLVMLKHSYFVAKYGLFQPTPSIQTPKETLHSDTAAKIVGQGVVETEVEPEQVSWADPKYPAIDYSIDYFRMAHAMNSKIHGRWIVMESEAAIDSNQSITAINVADPRHFNGFSSTPTMTILCSEGNSSLTFSFNDYLMVRDYEIPVEYRIDKLTPVSTRWNLTVNRKNVGVWERKAISFIKQLVNANKLYVRVTESNGSRHSETWDLRGIREASQYVAEACGWIAADLNREDLSTIQRLLRAAGFYKGQIDGIWGAGSRKGLLAYQQSQGLKATGTLNQETLESLGWRKP